jgi:small subunit ribosomal protein S18
MQKMKGVDAYVVIKGKPNMRTAGTVPQLPLCQFYTDKINIIDYKDIGKLRKFVSERGKIFPHRVTGNCAKHQRVITVAIKRARHMALWFIRRNEKFTRP